MYYWWVWHLSQYRVAGRRDTDFAESLQESVEEIDVSGLLCLRVIFGLCCSALPSFVTGLFPFCLIEKWWKLWVIRGAGSSVAAHLKLTGIWNKFWGIPVSRYLCSTCMIPALSFSIFLNSAKRCEAGTKHISWLSFLNPREHKYLGTGTSTM